MTHLCDRDHRLRSGWSAFGAGHIEARWGVCADCGTTCLVSDCDGTGPLCQPIVPEAEVSA
jgi:hypothetical protein